MAKYVRIITAEYVPPSGSGAIKASESVSVELQGITFMIRLLSREGTTVDCQMASSVAAALEIADNSAEIARARLNEYLELEKGLAEAMSKRSDFVVGR